MRSNLRMMRHPTVRKSESTESILEREKPPRKLKPIANRSVPSMAMRNKSEAVPRYHINNKSLEMKLGSLYPGSDFSILQHNAFPLAPLSRAAQCYISNTLKDFEKARVEKLPRRKELIKNTEI